ncbi:MAG TPA: NADH-quinone oxidoreductase subunit L [Stellaceae bacterium]|nr:NADH-quinone oxidoreductase subunit L [Stellaceae bacterium]
MLWLLWLVPALPLAGFAILFLTAGRLKKPAVAAIGVGSTGLSVVFAFIVTGAFLAAPPAGHAYHEVLWRWIAIGHFTPNVALRLDPLSLIMMLVVTFVGFLIHLYSAEFMEADEGYSRYFAWLNLFMAAMLVLVLAANLLLLYAGWEGVGLCSYLLIGFWYRDPANGRAARKAFIVTRIGDTAFILGIIYLFLSLGTLDIAALMDRARQAWPVGSGMADLAAALLLGGALGKSAQLPLQTWLPDAMAGPTPVSALIHAATMVTAGVYLIARTHVLFMLAPPVQLAVAAVGAATLLLAAFSALNQHDLKRIIAYSTISQIGYMFLALGVGAWTAAIFHFMTHAFFKSLLFLAAGAVMMRIGDEHDIFRMGGLWRRLPVAFLTFLAGAVSLSALPIISAGFYSKDIILLAAWQSGPSGPGLWAAGFVAAFLTALYIFRAVFIVFFGPMHTTPTSRYGWRIVVPLSILSVLALVGGLVETPAWLGGIAAFSNLLAPALPAYRGMAAGSAAQATVMAVDAFIAVFGVTIAYFAFLRRPALVTRLVTAPAARALSRFWLAGWGFDWLYDRVLVRPFVGLARLNRGDVIDAFYSGVAFANCAANKLLSETVNGRLRWYSAWLAAGSLAAIAIMMFA